HLYPFLFAVGACTAFVIYYFLYTIMYNDSLKRESFPAESPAASDHPYVSIGGSDEKRILGPYLEYIEDKGNMFTAEDAVSEKNEGLWKRNITDVPNFGFSSSAFWFRIRIKCEMDDPGERILEAGYPLLNELEFYQAGWDGRYRSEKAGSLMPFSQRAYEYINPVFQINMKPGKTNTYYLKVKSASSIQVPLILWSVRKFAVEKKNEYAAHFFYNGVLIVMFFYNLFLGIMTQNRNYFYYIAYLAGFFLLQSSISGFAFQYLWPAYPAVTELAIPLGIGIAVMWLCIFSMSYLNTSSAAPIFHKFSYVFIAWSGLLMTIPFFVPYKVSGRACTAIVIACMPYLAVMGAYCLYKGEKSAKFYLIAFFCLFVGAFIGASRMFGVLPSNFMTFYGFQIGSSIEMVLLSLAVGAKTMNDQKILRDDINELNIELRKKVKDQIRELKTANDKLKDFDQIKSRFFQNVSHEIRTPLTLILNPLERAVGASPGDNELQVAYKNSKRLLRLVNQLLDFQKLSSGKLELRLKPIRIGDFLETCAAYLMPTCFARNVRFFLDVRRDFEAIILGQIDALEKIIFNYLTNALKYSPEGGLISVSQYVENDKVVISVQDEGPGIPEDKIENLFNAYFQVEDSVKNKPEGTGLGLALVKELTESMRGRVFVSSKVGFGSIFGVEFPLYKINRKIFDLLVVDSEDETLSRICDHMRSEGIEVKSAKEVGEALRLLEESDFRCVLSGLDPGQSEEDMDLMEILYRKYPRTKRLLLSDRKFEDKKDEATNIGKIEKEYPRRPDLKRLSEDIGI
ncbi:MAG: hypothetical protein HQK54_16640, partial [Oligoflexales bacterium]|nr:hypothetical protein [Oligoflexales bacterium]